MDKKLNFNDKKQKRKQLSHSKKTLIVLTSTYPRWKFDSVPRFVSDITDGLSYSFAKVEVIAPHHKGSKKKEVLASGVIVQRIRYFLPESKQDLFYDQSASAKIGGSPIRLVKAFLYSGLVFLKLLLRRPNKNTVLNPRWLIPHGFVSVIVARIFSDVRVVTSVHGADIYMFNSQMLKLIKKFVLKYSDAVIVNSTHTKIACEKLQKRHYDIISSGFDAKIYKPKNYQLYRKSPESTLKLISVGRLSEEKGFIFIIKAVISLLNDGYNISLKIAGEGPEKQTLKKVIEDSGFFDRIELLGWVDKKDLPSIYRNADLFVGGSMVMKSGWQEAFGNVYAESMACGTPVIVPESAGVSSIIVHMQNGFKIKSVSQEELIRSIKFAYNNPLELVGMGLRCYEAVQPYSLEITIKKYLQVLTKDNQCGRN